YFSERTIGHLGFTGTSFWMDLDRGIIIILLTNRIHPSRDNNRIKAFRPKLHDAVIENVSDSRYIQKRIS
ncbi:MAG: serine hydrolase, partial [Deltaproteobacteria bacterium]|nr:serine hydrolase [Deltaproteobacteria bacterium]